MKEQAGWGSLAKIRIWGWSYAYCDYFSFRLILF